VFVFPSSLRLDVYTSLANEEEGINDMALAK